MSALNDYMCLLDRMTDVANDAIEAHRLSGDDVTHCNNCENEYPTEWVLEGSMCPFCGEELCPQEEGDE